jgi:hypothetical protein
MQFRHVLLGTAIAVASSVGAAQASTGWYLSLGAGANWVQDSDYKVKVPGPGTIITGNTDFDGGYVVAGSVGYDWGHWRAEFELADGLLSAPRHDELRRLSPRSPGASSRRGPTSRFAQRVQNIVGPCVEAGGVVGPRPAGLWREAHIQQGRVPALL